MAGVARRLGYRRDLPPPDQTLAASAIRSVLGGLGGAALLHSTPTAVFDRVVPLLILFATCLLMVRAILKFSVVGSRFSVMHQSTAELH